MPPFVALYGHTQRIGGCNVTHLESTQLSHVLFLYQLMGGITTHVQTVYEWRCSPLGLCVICDGMYVDGRRQGSVYQASVLAARAGHTGIRACCPCQHHKPAPCADGQVGEDVIRKASSLFYALSHARQLWQWCLHEAGMDRGYCHVPSASSTGCGYKWLLELDKVSEILQMQPNRLADASYLSVPCSATVSACVMAAEILAKATMRRCWSWTVSRRWRGRS